jgi:hypothetical protein
MNIIRAIIVKKEKLECLFDKVILITDLPAPNSFSDGKLELTFLAENAEEYVREYFPKADVTVVK